MREEAIRFSAYKIWEYDKSLSSEKCWEIAKENLRIFPDSKIECKLRNSEPMALLHIGMFGITVRLSQTIYVCRCREVFEYYFLHELYSKNYYNDHFYFISNKDVMEKAAWFIRNIEDMLGFDDLTQFKSCYSSGWPVGWSAGGDGIGIIWVKPSGFWQVHPIRNSLLTVLFRCGIMYNGNIDDAILSTEYGSLTYDGIKRFLDGKTTFTGEYDINKKYGWGWVNNFAAKSKEEVERLLV